MRILYSALALFFILPAVVSAATLSVGSGGTHAVGETFVVPLYVSTENGEAMNAVEANVTFPPGRVRIVSINDTGIIDFWAAKPHYSNTKGTVALQGVVYNPGFSGSNGKLLSVTFQATKKGEVAIIFGSASVLANDGQGTRASKNDGHFSFLCCLKGDRKEFAIRTRKSRIVDDSLECNRAFCIRVVGFCRPEVDDASIIDRNDTHPPGWESDICFNGVHRFAVFR